MAKIPQEVQEFMKGKMAWVATASPEGMPNATPKGTVKVLDDEHLMFVDLFSRKTRENLLKNPKVAVTVIDLPSRQGFQIKGSAELLSRGGLFEQTVAELKKSPKQLPPPTYVVKIKVEAVYDQSVGPEAGKQIA